MFVPMYFDGSDIGTSCIPVNGHLADLLIENSLNIAIDDPSGYSICSNTLADIPS